MYYLLALSAITGTYAAVSFLVAALKPISEPDELAGPVVGMELFIPEEVTVAPMYSGNSVMVPVGGGKFTDYRKIFSMFRSDILIGVPAQTYKNYTPISINPTKISFINNNVALDNIQARMNMPLPLTEFPIVFPMKVREYHLPKSAKVFVCQRHIGTDRFYVVLAARMARKWPLTATAVTVSAVAFGADWVFTKYIYDTRIWADMRNDMRNLTEKK